MTDLVPTDIVPANPTEAAILSRRAVRGFLSAPVSQADIEHLLNVAARAPSGTNMQPWRVIALAGQPLADFTTGMVAGFKDRAETGGSERPYYPSPQYEPYLSRRRKLGWDLYGTLGIARGETDKMAAHGARNLEYFGAPVGLVCMIDRKLQVGSWIDYGCFLENIAIAARGRGLDTCHMAIFAEFHTTVRRLLNLPEDDIIVCGVAIGYADPDAPANALVTTRVPAAAFSQFRGV